MIQSKIGCGGQTVRELLSGGEGHVGGGESAFERILSHLSTGVVAIDPHDPVYVGQLDARVRPYREGRVCPQFHDFIASDFGQGASLRGIEDGPTVDGGQRTDGESVRETVTRGDHYLASEPRP